jgi:hypothetical protein
MRRFTRLTTGSPTRSRVWAAAVSLYAMEITAFEAELLDRLKTRGWRQVSGWDRR